MARTTIDFGIDLGTTNSAVAKLRGTITDIAKNNVDNDITPSAVFIDRRGQIQVGLRAKNRLEHEESADDVYIEFKRRMGTDHKYTFKSAGRVMLPEDLSAEVLKSLREDVRQRLNEDVQAAVITVPAAFEQKQCAATRKAGETAGLLQCPLLQEPVAAALAYGFQSDVTKEYWLIYDFGGGTFDAAIMKAEDGSITVVNHGGDNYLGGSDIDWAVLEQLVIPELADSYNLPDFVRGSQRWKTALAVAKRSVEEAKIQLSRSESAYLEDCRFRDADGNVIEVEFKLTRGDLVRIAEPIIMRSVDITRRVLKEKNLAPAAIEKMILVGGPTLAPYFREMLQTTLGIPLDCSVDPLTVVARGAGVFAGTQFLEGAGASKAAAGQFSIELKYKPVGPDLDPTVRGVVSSPSGVSVEGFTLEVVNQQTRWRSGKVVLKADGRFKVDLLAQKGVQNTFTIELLDSRGARQVAIPDRLAYTVGLAISDQPVINSIAVALANNEPDVFFRKGEPLPAKATRVYRSTHALKKGESGDVLRVPVVEGEVEIADRNRLLGSLEIRGQGIRRDLPAGTEVEVTLHIDASRIIRAKAYIPMLDEEYEAVIDYNGRSPDHALLKKEFDAEVNRLNDLRTKAEAAEEDKVTNLIAETEESARFEDVEGLLDAAKGDPDAANKAEKQLLEIKVKLDRVEEAVKWPSFVSDANTALEELDALVKDHGDAEQQQQARTLREQVQDLIAQGRAEPLRRKVDQIYALQRQILFELPGFWLGYFNHLVGEKARMQDQDAAERLITQGRQCVDRGSMQGLRSVVSQLLRLLPEDVAEAVQRGYQSGVLK